MFYRLRKQNGQTDPHSAGKWVRPGGKSQSLVADDVSMEPLRYWTSPSGRHYPVSWKLEIPKLQQQLVVDALIDDQEMATGIYYWEGAVKVSSVATKDLLGYGYLEMTGY
jgi:predicted secreted hydrolase